MPGFRYLKYARISASIAAAAIALAGCNNYDSSSSPSSQYGTSYRQVNLVSDTSLFPAANTDKNLVNPWGIAVGPTGVIWVSDNHTGMSSLYNGEGHSQGNPVTIPGAPADSTEMPPIPGSSSTASTGAPTGVVYNGTAGFLMPDSTGKAVFIFAGEDGTISAWNSGSAAKIVVDRSDSGSVYKGIALASDSGKEFIYLADFRNRHVDVFDAQFHRDTTRHFADSTIPADFGPFNVALIGSELFVAYARLKGPENEDDSAGVGAGYVNVFGTNGVLKRRFVSQSKLNSPWAMISIPGTYGPFDDGIYIGNFGDGLINVFDAQGNFLGEVQDSSGHPVLIEGLWGLYLSKQGDYGSSGSRLYFAAGPADEEHGLFGYLIPE